MGIPGDDSWYRDPPNMTENTYPHSFGYSSETKKRLRSDLEASVDKGFKRLRVGDIPPTNSMLRLPSVPLDADADYRRVNAILGLLHNERSVRKNGGHTPQFRTV